MKLTIPSGVRFWHQKDKKFLYTKETEVELEHSLFSIALWEERTHKRFLDESVEKTPEELQEYVKCMVRNPDDIGEVEWIYLLTNAEITQKMSEYVNDSHTATTIYNKKNGGSGEPVSAELIYYWMFSAQIPMECEHWHLNKLITLIAIYAEKQNQASNKPSERDVQERHRRIHEQRKAERLKREAQENANKSIS